MGGSSKPADPVVTPFQEPAAPKNPVPNWFSGGGQANTFAPDFSQSAKPFGNPAPVAQPVAQPAPQPAMQQPMQGGMGDYSQPMQPVNDGRMGFSIPTRPQGYAGPRNAGGNPFMADGNFGPMSGDMRANMDRMITPDGQQGFQDRILGMFKGGINGLQNAPRLQNLMGSFSGQAPAPSWTGWGQTPEAPDFYGVRPGTDRRA